MRKVLFFNTADIKKIKFDDDDDLSWQKSPRVSSLFSTTQKTEVCLYHFSKNDITVGDIVSLNKLSALANLYTTDYSMKNDGLFPLLLIDNTLYFTDIEEYSFLDRKWASGNVYKTNLRENEIPQFNLYVPEKIEAKGWHQGIIAAQNIRVGGLFGKVTEVLPSITEFCLKQQQGEVEITYSDRYVKNELSLVICLQFIRDLLAKLQPTSYKVKMIGATFYEINANDDSHRRLSDSFISELNRDETGKHLINDSNFEFESKSKEDIPHYRELLVKVNKGGTIHSLRIMPDAGLGHWGLDIQTCKAIRQYFSTNNGVNSEIPICSSTEQVYYIS